jgi:hypothetical protein
MYSPLFGSLFQAGVPTSLAGIPTLRRALIKKILRPVQEDKFIRLKFSKDKYMYIYRYICI